MKKNLLIAATTVLAAATAAQAAPVSAALASNPSAFVTQSSVKPRLEKLMGLINARFLQKNFGTVSTLQKAGGIVAVTGCRPHDCGSNGSLVIYNQKRDAFKVWLTVNDKTRVFTEKGWANPLNLNSDVTAAIDNMGN